MNGGFGPNRGPEHSNLTALAQYKKYGEGAEGLQTGEEKPPSACR
jgi:hypothetical protein